MFKNRAWYQKIVYVAPLTFLGSAMVALKISPTPNLAVGFLNTTVIATSLVCIVEGTNRILKAMEDSFIARAKSTIELKNIMFEGLKATREVNVAEFEAMQKVLLSTLSDQEKIDEFTNMFAKKVTDELRLMLQVHFSGEDKNV